MDLHVTLASAPPVAFPVREIVVDTTTIPTGAALVERLQVAGYAGPFTVDGTPLGAITPYGAAFPPGSVIVSGEPERPSKRTRLPHLVFVVHSGPDAGQVVPLTRGSYTIGRASNDIIVSDPGLSRDHALLTVGEDSILIEDLGSVNGSFVDGEAITEASISVSSCLRFGASRCSVALVDEQGWIPGVPQEILEPVPVGCELPKRPSKILVLTALLPLVLGVVLALTTGMWFFLAFSGLSAVTGLVPLLTYRRNFIGFTAALKDSAEHDRCRRMVATPDPGQSALDALRTADQPSPADAPTGQPRPDVILLRLGTAHQPACVSVERADNTFAPPLLRDVPLLLCSPPSERGGTTAFTVAGEPDAVRGLMRALLLQAAHPRSGTPRVVCWGAAYDLPHHARFLPNVLLTHDPDVLAQLARQAGVLLVFHVSDDVPELVGASTVVAVRFLPGDRATPGPSASIATGEESCLMLSAATALVRLDGIEYEAIPDGVSERTFERTARALARTAVKTSPSTHRRNDAAAGAAPHSLPPASASMWSGDFSPDTLRSLVPDQWAHADPERPTAHLGRSAAGPLSIDLVKDGPHLVVAGTTGSGKSEFLRTLVLGLALNQPPEHLTFLLIDYKGGSGLGALASLPHCVGTLTDLSSESTARALTSLRAELRRGEALCAASSADDLDALRRVSPSSCPPRLVVVIDEFRILSDDVPTAVSDLMKMAALGRSLGVHLVLATQRVQGAVTPDLRTNITSSILLRVQTAMESHDLLGSGVAAAIPVECPGRAYLRRGAEVPIAFQIATSSSLPVPTDTPGWQDFATYLGAQSSSVPHRSDTHLVDPRSASHEGSNPIALPIGSRTTATAPGPGSKGNILERAVAALVDVAGGSGVDRPRRPVLAPLPALLTSAACRAFPPVSAPGTEGSSALNNPAIALGVIDLPERQDQRSLDWHPGEHSHLALVGLSGSGAAEALATVIRGLPAADPDIHLYLLDGDRTLADCAAGPHVGAYVEAGESKRAARVLERLAALPARRSDRTTCIVLAVTGWGRWCSQFRQGRLARAEEDLHALIRDGAGCGVTVLIDGDRELTASRFFALIPNRIYLPLGAHQETTMTWPKLPPVDAAIGRGFAQGPVTGAAGDGICQLVISSSAGDEPVIAPALSPFPVYPLPRSVSADEFQAALSGLGAAGLDGMTLALGLHGDDLLPYCVALRSGEVFLLLGHAASGRTNALSVLRSSAARLLPRPNLLAPPNGVSVSEATTYWRGVSENPSGADLQSCLLLVDDADQLPADVQQKLSGLVARGAAAVLAAAPSASLMTRVPLSLQARGTGRGLILSPQSSADGDFLGVRLDLDAAGIPGRGHACGPFGVKEVQIAHAPCDVGGSSTAIHALRPIPTAFSRGRPSAP
ncbi:FHA domain-containing protein [Arthrobacter cheniae]|uniref:FHA domain-containing protein n=1 Tax=Arthrobacter cheniae TaxID=1258888 RepID=A0A3A5M916_9MICC|nr:FtsK/SpoIIIE domain-containing protein [Arthrobacter cheniae]RJT78271.1 FHA domain-containing protein [Arthrobacter cheniae]